MHSASALPAVKWIVLGMVAFRVQVIVTADDDTVSVADADEPQAAAEPDWSNVVDKVALRTHEAEHYYFLLNKAANTNLGTLRVEAEEFRQQRWTIAGEPRGKTLARFHSFVDVMLNPEQYRGKPISLDGHTQDILVSDAGENMFGIETLYEAWLYTAESQQIPTIVVCTEIPDGLQTGRQLIDGIRVTGYFLKLHAYQAQDGKMHFAPLILAHRLEWDPVPAAMHLPNWFIGLGGVGLVLLVAWVWWTTRLDREFRNQRLSADATAVDLKDLRLDE